MPSRRSFIHSASAATLLAACGPRGNGAPNPRVELHNVSYDPTREFYAEINPAFSHVWRQDQSHGPLTIAMSHGGSGAQTRAVIEGAPAQVVTLATPFDIDQIADAGLTDHNWRARLPNNSAPYTSIIVFVVRAGNPKAIRDWADLTRADVKVVTPDPKTSGGARWTYLAAWAYALRQPGGAASAPDFMRRMYENVAWLDSGARASTERFTQAGEGDVLLAWENEAHLISSPAFEIVAPSMSIRAEPAVAVIDANTSEPHVRAAADAYLQFLYTLEAQEIAARHYYRPFDESILARNADRFPAVPLVSVEDTFTNWAEAYRIHFADGGVFDSIR